MAEVLDRVEAEGRLEGRVQALYYDAEFTIEKVAEKLELSEDKIRESLEGDNE